MNGAAEQIAKSRAQVAKLNALFAHLEKVEPGLVQAAENLFFAEIDALMPRLRSYVLETGKSAIDVQLTLTVDFNQQSPRVVLKSHVTPPAYNNERSSGT